MDVSLIYTLLVVLVLAAAGAWAIAARRRQGRRMRALQQLVELADRLEADLRSCRSGLEQAHAVMAANPDLPGSSEQDARHAVDAGLQALLRQRIWIRDHAARASQRDLDATVATMQTSRERLQPLLDALSVAQHDLDSAMREHIHRDAD